jgi:Flp pilus assembly pilin Flp
VTLLICILSTVQHRAADCPWRHRSPRRDSERGQGTVEYALILLCAAAIALVVVAWVSRTDLIGRLFDTVVGRILTQAG